MPQTLPAALAPLAAHRQFIVCQLLPDPSRPGKTLKWPLHPRTLHRHDAHDPAAWLSHGEAVALVETLGGRTASTGYILGFAFTPSDPFWFIDIDNCHTGTGWSAEAMRIAGMVPGAAIEVSQSGRGLHIFGTYGARPDHSSAPSADLGFYTEKRFVALTCDGVTGDITARPALDTLIAEYFPPGADVESEGWTEEPVATWAGEQDDDKLLARALASGSPTGAFQGRASFADLWRGNAEALGRTWPDGEQGRAWEATAADGALAGHLAFWTGKNCARIERLMMRDDCALRRDKYDRPDREAGTYLRRTIVGAVARCSAVYGERGAKDSALTQQGQEAPNSIASAGGPALSFTAAAGGLIAATVANVESALLADESGIRIARDTFKEQICIGEGDAWRAFEDEDYGHLRAALERRGFKPVPAEVMKTVVGMVAGRNKFDSAMAWANALVWNGVPRVTMALHRYYGVEDTPYTRACSEYLFTGLAGRCLSPGAKADMALILVGLQGERKTSAVSALAPDPEAFTGVDLSHRDDNLARQLRGKLVIELAEMRGLSQGRELEGIKDWLSRCIEEWTPKYKEFSTRFKRRCICIGTANEIELLDDPTGERRWLPLVAGRADVEAIERDRAQLWAEGVAMWRQGGIRWQEAERLAKAEHHKFKVHDEWRGAVVRWLSETPSIAWGNSASNVVNGDQPFSMLRVAKEALFLAPDRMGMSEQKRIGKLLRTLGYVKKDVWNGSMAVKLWVRARGDETGDKIV
jgi:hypothetical protein